DPSHVAFFTFPGAMPELALDPGHPGDEAVRLDRAQDLAGVGIDLVDLAVAILSHPQGSLGPGEAGVAAAAGRGDGGEHTAAVRIDLVDLVLGDLKQVLAVEGRSRMRGHFDAAQGLAALGIERDQPVACGKPDLLAVIGDAADAVDALEGTVLP